MIDTLLTERHSKGICTQTYVRNRQDTKELLSADSKCRNSLWLTTRISTVRLDKIKEHSISDMHNTSISIETSQNIRNATADKTSEETPIYKAVERAMKCFNFLIE